MKADEHFAIGAGLGDQAPGIAQISLDAKGSGDLESFVQWLHARDVANIECPDLAMQRRTSNRVPTAPAEQQLVRTEPGDNSPIFAKAVVRNLHGPSLGNV